MKRLSCAALMLLAPLVGHAALSPMEDQSLAAVHGQATDFPSGVLVQSENGIFKTYTVFDQTLYVPFDVPEVTGPTGPRPIVIGNLFCDTCAIIAGLKIGAWAYVEILEGSLLSIDPFPVGQTLAALNFQKAARLSTVARRLYYGS